MVYSVSPGTSNSRSISLSREAVDRPQQVCVTINGFEYRGEVVLADLWQPWFGSSLPARVMFRLVLLTNHQRIDLTDISERSIVVAVPADAPTPAAGGSEIARLNREIGRLNEIRERYVTSNDSGLQALASSLTGRQSEAQRDMAAALGKQWQRGEVLTAAEHNSLIAADSIFIGHEPDAWVEAVAAGMFLRHNGPADQKVIEVPEALFTSVINEDETQWSQDLDRLLRSASGSGFQSFIQVLDNLVAEGEGRVQGGVLRSALLRQNGLPPGLATLMTVAYIKLKNGEADLSQDSRAETRLNSHTLAGLEWEPELVYSLEWLNNQPANDWNSALPYIRALLPHAKRLENGSPDQQLEQELMQTLRVCASRAELTVRTLEATAPGSQSVPAVGSVKLLLPVLQVGSWSDFYARARKEFPSARGFSAAITESSRLRAVCEDIVDVRAAHDYVHAADFGRQDHSIAADAEALKSRLDVNAILANHTSAASALHDFQQWRRLYIRAYTSHHADRRSADLELALQVKQADMQHAAVLKLITLPGLDGIYDPSFTDTWDELKQSIRPCVNREHELSLQTLPYCSDCGVRMGSTGREDEVNSGIVEIKEMLQLCSLQLSKIATARVLSGEREEEIRKLVRINSIADLTSVAHLLDEGVMAFLERFATD